MQVAEKAYDEMIDLFARGSSPREIVHFHPSRTAQERATYLLDRNKTDELTAEEAAELERLGELEHFMQLVKTRARLYAESAP
jgi:hypothetical protein